MRKVTLPLGFWHRETESVLARVHHGRQWTAEDDDILRSMSASGAYLNQIAEALGRTQEAVRTRANTLHIPVRSAPRASGRLKIRL
jgi:hypothetical protein